MTKRKKILMLVLAILALVLLVFCYHKLEERKHSYDSPATEVSDLTLFGDRNQYLALKTSFRTAAIQVGENFLVDQEYLNQSYNSPPISEETWQWNLYLYDLRQEKPKKKKVNLNKALEAYDANYYPVQQGIVVVQEGTEYLVFRIESRKDKSKDMVALLDLNSRKVTKIIDTKKYNWAVYYFHIDSSSLGKAVDEQGFRLSRDNLYADKPPIGTEFNFSQEYPQIRELLNSTKSEEVGMVFFRKGLVSAEEQFQTFRHWFAPVGQDKLEVIGVKSFIKDGETVSTHKVLNTYQEYYEWENSGNQKVD